MAAASAASSASFTVTGAVRKAVPGFLSERGPWLDSSYRGSRDRGNRSVNSVQVGSCLPGRKSTVHYAVKGPTNARLCTDPPSLQSTELHTVEYQVQVASWDRRNEVKRAALLCVPIRTRSHTMCQGFKTHKQAHLHSDTVLHNATLLLELHVIHPVNLGEAPATRKQKEEGTSSARNSTRRGMRSGTLHMKPRPYYQHHHGQKRSKSERYL